MTSITTDDFSSSRGFSFLLMFITCVIATARFELFLFIASLVDAALFLFLLMFLSFRFRLSWSIDRRELSDQVEVDYLIVAVAAGVARMSCESMVG